MISVRPGDTVRWVRPLHATDAFEVHEMNRATIPILFALIALVVVSAPAAAQANVAGNWLLTVESPEAGGDIVAVFAQDGSTVTGTLEVPMVGGAEMTDGLVENNTLSFLLHVDFDGTWFTVEVKAEVEGDSMAGSVYVPEMGSMPFTGRRTES